MPLTEWKINGKFLFGKMLKFKQQSMISEIMKILKEVYEMDVLH